MRSEKLLFSFVLILAALCCAHRQVAAQTQSIGLSPAYLDASVQTGKSYKQDFVISNQTKNRLHFRCFTGDVWYDEANKQTFGRPGTLPRSASLWVQFTPAEIVVEPLSSSSVKAVITVPQDAVGGYYTMPFFEGEPLDLPPETLAKGEARASFGIRIGGLLMFATTETSEYHVQKLGGEITPPGPSAELELRLELHNRGTAHVRVKGVLAVLDAAGRLAGRGKIEEKRYLPGQRDTLKAFWPSELAPGPYTAVVTLSYDRAGLEPETLVYELPFAVKKQP